MQGEAEQPRILLVSVPYALKAAEAETLGGRTATDFVLADRLESELQEKAETIVRQEVQTLTEEGSIPAITTGPSTFSGNNSTQILRVRQSGSGVGILATAETNAAVQGLTSTGIGMRGRSNNASGFGIGVLGDAESVSGTGVWGQALNATGSPTGVKGLVNSVGGTAGVFQNTAGGKILSGRTTSGTEVFSLDGSGNLTVDGSAVGGSGGFRVEQTASSPNLIGGFSGNSVTAGVVGASIGGGGESGFTNRVFADFGTIGGGEANTASDSFATVGGGLSNTASDSFATVGGGQNNTASGTRATVGGGDTNTASGTRATVGGGDTNTASSINATVPGGRRNTASGGGATVGGGLFNTGSGSFATVPGGQFNIAQGSNSFAAGCQAQALHDGAFVWGDSTCSVVSSTAANQFIARASGGVTFFSSFDTAPPAPGVNLPAGASAWITMSDRASKENFAPVDGQALLARLNAIPLLTWNWRAQDASIRHMGPMAQDFRAAFGLGSDDKHISTVDADGVALAAIQELYRMVLQKNDQLQKMQAQMLELQAELALVKAQFTRDREVQTAALASLE